MNGPNSPGLVLIYYRDIKETTVNIDRKEIKCVCVYEPREVCRHQRKGGCLPNIVMCLAGGTLGIGITKQIASILHSVCREERAAKPLPTSAYLNRTATKPHTLTHSHTHTHTLLCLLSLNTFIIVCVFSLRTGSSLNNNSFPVKR